MGKQLNVAVVTNAKKITPEVSGAVQKALGDRGLGACPWLEAPKGSKAGACARRAIKGGANLVLVVGGDGTVRSVANELAGTKVVLGVVPGGTANLFANYLELPTDDPEQAVDIALARNVTMLDVGRCNGEVFNVMAGVGFDAAMVEGPSTGMKKRLGMLSYIVSGAKEARRRTATQTRVKIDGTEWFSGPATGVLVGNIGKLTGGVEVFPGASPFDGRLEVGVVTAEGVREWAGVMARLARSEPDDSPHVRMSSGRRISVKLDTEEPYELDGGGVDEADKMIFTCDAAALRVSSPLHRFT